MNLLQILEQYMIGISKSNNFWLFTFFGCLMGHVSVANANSDAPQITYLCVPDRLASVAITEETVGRGNFSDQWKFLVSGEYGTKWKFKEFDDSDWTPLTSFTHLMHYGYVDTQTHFSFFPKGFNELTFKYDHTFMLGYTKDKINPYRAISLVGGCSPIN